MITIDKIKLIRNKILEMFELQQNFENILNYKVFYMAVIS